MSKSKGWRTLSVLFSITLLCLAALYYRSNLKHDNELVQPSIQLHDRTTINALEARQDPGVNIPLRLLPIGDSITEGYGAFDKNGYRLALKNNLVNAGYSVDFIGSLTGGDNNPDNQHEGYGGYTIRRILEQINGNRILGQHPNIVLIHAGTNDINADSPDEPHDSAGARLATMIDTVLCEDADAIVLVAMIIQIPRVPDRLRSFNAAIPGIVAQRYQRGFKIRVVDQSQVGASDLADGLHPSDAGYRKMAQIWSDAIRALPAEWFTQPRDSNKRGSAQTCARDSLYWASILNDRWIASGAKVPGDTGEPLSNNITINGTTTYLPVWNPIGTVSLGLFRPGNQTVFLDIDGDGKADYGVLSPEGALIVSINKGGGSWELLNGGNPVASGAGTGQGIYFADVNNDKRDDFIVVREGGLIEVFTNGGGFFGSWIWNSPVPLHTVAGVGPYDLTFGDLNGDGLSDFLVNNTDGSVDAYIQTGSPGTFTWSKCTNVATTTGNPNIRLVDLDGDKRDDFISIDEQGGLTGWLNLKDTSQCGSILFSSIRGRQGVANGAAPGAQVRLADYDGDGRFDYLVVRPYDGAVDAFLNQGVTDNPTTTIAGPERRGPGGFGAGVRLADLDGDGRDDYLAVGPIGEVLAYINGGQLFDGWHWIIQNDGNLIAAGHAGAKRHQIHFADINGDGKADYLAVNDDTGAAFCYYNGGPGSGGWVWTPVGEIAAGVADKGIGVRFADLDGDGRADYLWLNEDGSLIAYLNKGVGDRFDGWFPVNNRQFIASGTGARRKDVHFMDYDGDGRADYVWVHPEDGSVDVWFNGGPFDGGWLWWYAGDKVAAGIGMPGEQITFGRIGTSGRYDYVGIEPTTAALRGFYNQCFKIIGSGGGVGGAPFDGTCLAAPMPTPSGPDPGSPSAPAVPDTTSVNSQGQTVISGTQGVISIPTGLTTVTTITSNGQTITYTPPPPDLTTTNAQGETIISGTRGVITLQPGITATSTITSNGQTFTFVPPPQQDVTTTDSVGQTVISGTRGVVTLPTGITTPTTITSNGQTITIAPDTTTTNSQGQTVISNTRGVITLPTGITEPITTTQSGVVFTFRPSPTTTTTSSGIPPLYVWFPITGSRPEEGTDDDNYVVPCDIWFFTICIQWLNLDIKGWRIPIPTGRTIGPGPPPAITISGVIVNTIRPLPPIPLISVPPNGRPTYTPSSKPSDCKTITGEVCLTSISYGVSSTSTTTTVTQSTCLSVYGCRATDSAETTTRTGLTNPACTYTPPPSTPRSTTATTTLPVSVPSGSECVSSVLVTSNGTPSQSCVSSRPTLTPQTVSSVVCHSESALPGHGDVQGQSVESLGKLFCETFNNYRTNSTGPWPNQQFLDNREINYRFQAAWKPNCRQQNATPLIPNPLDQDISTSRDICRVWMANNHYQCNNGGIGGYTDVGCLRYNFIGGIGESSPVPNGFGWI